MTSLSTAHASGASALSIEGVAADYNHGRVMSDVAFHVAQGETFGLMGLNGAGKTTLIKILLGLMDAAEGRATVFGEIPGSPAAKKKIAYLPEKFEPPAFLNCYEFVKFSLELYGRSYDKEAVNAMALRLGLPEDALKRRVNTYSKGMRQKAGLMGTILTECPLLILDEPMSGLDPLARAQVKDEIIACKKRGMTVFLSSHILADMDEICDRVTVMHEGSIRFTGTPAGLRQNTGQEYLERAFLKVIETNNNDKTKKPTRIYAQ